MTCEALQKQREKKRKNKVITNNMKEEGYSDDACKCKSCEEIWHGEDDDK